MKIQRLLSRTVHYLAVHRDLLALVVGVGLSVPLSRFVLATGFAFLQVLLIVSFIFSFVISFVASKKTIPVALLSNLIFFIMLMGESYLLNSGVALRDAWWSDMVRLWPFIFAPMMFFALLWSVPLHLVRRAKAHDRNLSRYDEEPDE